MQQTVEQTNKGIDLPHGIPQNRNIFILFNLEYRHFLNQNNVPRPRLEFLRYIQQPVLCLAHRREQQPPAEPGRGGREQEPQTEDRAGLGTPQRPPRTPAKSPGPASSGPAGAPLLGAVADALLRTLPEVCPARRPVAWGMSVVEHARKHAGTPGDGYSEVCRNCTLYLSGHSALNKRVSIWYLGLLELHPGVETKPTKTNRLRFRFLFCDLIIFVTPTSSFIFPFFCSFCIFCILECFRYVLYFFLQYCKVWTV